MSWRFKASKYKNAAAKAPKFENLIRDLSIGAYMSHGNFIAASAAYMAFNWDTNGSNLAVLPIDTKGRQNKTAVPLIHAHPEFVTDFQFSPFDDGLLATGSQDTTVKLWRIPESGMPIGGINVPELTLDPQPRRIETINFNPTADGVLATSSGTNLVVWDLFEGKEVFAFEDHVDYVQSVCWQASGQLLATQSRDKQLRIIDPRCPSKQVSQCESHQGIKDSKVVWLSDDSRVLTSGFNKDRDREIFIRDIRNLTEPQKTLALDMSSGIVVPLYDPDTNMCFLCGKGDRNIQFVEITNSDPFIVDGLRYSGDQTKGACLVPKRAMCVMQGEVNRVLQLCDSTVVPVTWQVPRKSYREYHADIYPETNGYEAMMGPTEWCRGDNTPVPKINLDPKKRPKEVLTVYQGPLAKRKKNFQNVSRKSSTCSEKSMSPSSDMSSERSGESPNNGHPSVNEKEIFSNSATFVKPSPRPRTKVIRSNTAASSTASEQSDDSMDSIPKPNKLEISPINPKPQPRLKPSQSLDQSSNHNSSIPQRNGSTNSGDTVDEGLAALRRQPSIRDRRKLFEETIKKNQTDSSSNGFHNGNKSVFREVKPIAENGANKENKECETPLKKIEEKHDPPVLRKKKPVPDQVASTGAASQTKRPVSKMFGRLSKFKHLKGDVLLKGKFDNLKNLSRTVPAECNFFQANPDRVAVPLTGPGGKIAVFESRKPGRIQDGVQPVLINGTTVMDFDFDPFDNARLGAGCDDGFVKLWRIPCEGLTSQTNEPEESFAAHVEKIQIIKFHPLANNVLLTSAFDRSVKIWNLGNTEEPAIELNGHTEQLFSAEWSPCGNFVATVCKDGKIRIFEPRSGSDPIQEGGEIVPKKGARILWVLEGHYLIVTGFSRQSERQVMMFRANDLEEVAIKVLDVSPTILVPYYDADSSTLFVTGKGESTVATFEVAHDAPHLFDLSPYKPAGLHQGFAFLPKIVCNVREVEFARAYRITNTTIEPISFTVPRVKTAFFQDDLFPDTKVLWEPTVTADEWFKGSTKQPRKLDLRPEGMRPLSDNRASSATPRASTVIAEKPKMVNNEPPRVEKIKHNINVKVANDQDWSD